MTASAYIIVLGSTVTHAYWNYLLKRHGGRSTFIGLSKVLEVVIFLPFFVIFSLPDLLVHPSPWILIGVGAALSLLNYAALGRAYEIGNLSVVYPVSRGAMLLFLPVLAFYTIGERLNAVGWLAIVLVIAGIVMLKLEAMTAAAFRALSSHARDPAIGFALIAALAAAGYAIWDKHAIQTLATFAYFYSYTVIVAVAYTLFLVRSHGARTLTNELRSKWRPIAQVAVLNTVSYVLVLVALTSGKASYVVALRQLSIAVGALLGWRLLSEKFEAPQKIGVALIVAGCIAVALAR